MDPTIINLPQGAPGEGVSAISTMGMPIATVKHVHTATCVTNARDHTPNACVLPLDQPGQVGKKTKPRKGTIDHPEPNKINLLPTPVSVENLETALSSHPKQNFVLELCNIFKYGAHIGFQGKRSARFSKNLPTAFENPDIISANLAKEVSLGRTAGPFDTPPFSNLQVSPIGLVPKKNSGKFRTIFHLSYPKSGSSSINYHISKEDFGLQYVTIDDAISGIQLNGPGCFLAKTDIELAFRLIPIHPNDYELLGMYWKGKYYYDKVLPFGLRSAPCIFNKLSDALEWILVNNCNISFACHILDDFLIIKPPASQPPFDTHCQTSLDNMLSTFKTIGIPIAEGKTQGPSQVLEFMGILLDTVKMEARLPPDKIAKLNACLNEFERKKSCTLKELQSLIGTLNFACKVVPPGRPFLQRMIALTRNVLKSHHHIRLNVGFFHDLQMWKKFISHWNGANFFLSSTWHDSNTLDLHTDASGALGYGGIYGNKWFQGKWKSHQLLDQPGVSIAWQELYAIVVACEIWGNLLHDQRIRFNCDNESVVSIINTKRSKIPRMMDLLRHLTLLTLQHNIYICAVHIPGKHNDIADAISRFQYQRFRQLAPEADISPYPIPEIVLTL